MVSRLHYLPDQMFVRIELGAGAPAELVRLLPLLGLEPLLLERAQPASLKRPDFAISSNPATAYDFLPNAAASDTDLIKARPTALRVEFGISDADRAPSAD